MISHEDNLRLRSCSIYWPEGVVVLITHEDKLKLRSYYIYWPEGVAFLIAHEDNFKLRSYSMAKKVVAVLILHEE